jgi:type IV pilus assembly protein PilY1
MDTSGSMGWDFMPDNVNPVVPGVNSADYPFTTNSQDYPYKQGYTCLTNADGNNECMAGDPPYYAYQFNFVAYNPTFTYSPGVNYDGSNRPSMGSPWTNVPVDQYTASSGNINLAGGNFPEQAYTNSAGTFKRNGELYCPGASATCAPGNLPPTENGLTVTTFSYATPKSPPVTGVSLSGFGSGMIVTATKANHGIVVGDLIDVICTSGGPISVPYPLAHAVPVMTVPDANHFTFYAGQNWGTGNLSCTQATANFSVVGLPEQAGVSITVPANANGVVYNSGPKTVTVNFYNHMLVVGDVITVTGGGTTCKVTNVPVTAVSVSNTAPYVGVPTSFTYSYSGSACSGTYTIARQPYTNVLSGTSTPFSYRLTPTEYCADQHLSYCLASTVPLPGYSFPAVVRFCNSAAAAAAAPTAAGSPVLAPPNPLPTSYSCENKYDPAQGYIYPRYGQFSRNDVVSTTTTYTNWPTRTDCGTGTPTPPPCTYAQEMTNFANWYAYYRTRIQMMKTLVGQSFLNITGSYRVGYITINPAKNTSNPVSSSNQVSTTHYVPVSDFTATQKQSFYSTLYAQAVGNSTPLRGALARAGRYFAGKHDQINSGISDDPMQYSCQQNFVLLTTDGYWNSNASNPDAEAVGLDGVTPVGDQDANAATQTQGIYEGGNCPQGNYNSGGCANTLADVAAYYYNTDLRDSSLGNATGALGSDVATDNVPKTPTDPNTKQHMTTFTLGLADGLMTWQSNYATAGSGDFQSIISSPVAKGCWWPPVNGSAGTACQWPVPMHDQPTALDDLWHAAVNGHGTYYHGTNPRSVANGLASALSGINVRLAAAAASSTSSPNITQQNNVIYSSTYDTTQWNGDLIAQTVNPADGTVNKTPLWDAATTLDTMVGASSDSRTIYSLDLGTKVLKPFAWTSMTAGEQALFANICTPPTNLTQCVTLSSSQLNQINDGYDLVNFLRGQRGNEGTLFFIRTHVLGDTVDAQPAYVAGPTYAFADAVAPPYGPAGVTGTYATNYASRQPVLYIGANDGMLHAFDAQVGTGHNGSELWAYIPRVLWSKLYQLSDINYGNLHQFYVDGSPQVMDVYFGNAWHTVLVGGLNAGGRGYYALDVTNPTAPVALWEFCSNSVACTVSDPDLGLTFGNPIITKRASDGRWVVLVTSGYNNVPGVPSAAWSTGSGQEYLYVLDIATGQVLQKLGTSTGTVASPGGMAKISAWADNFNLDNTTKYVYGGDLQGNVWRFDLTASPATVMKLGMLVDGSGNPQPVTTKPELASVQGYRVIYIGTGEYMGTSDLSTTKTQSLYAFKDLGTPYGNVRTGANLVQQTISNIDSSDRTSSNSAVDWNQKNGWYVDFPTAGERVNIDPQLVLGTLIVDTNIPTNGACVVGGSSWHYEFDYLKGAYVSTAQGVLATYNSSAVTVGFVVVQLPGGGLKAIDTDATATKGTQGINVGNSPLSGKRVGWRQM